MFVFFAVVRQENFCLLQDAKISFRFKSFENLIFFGLKHIGYYTSCFEISILRFYLIDRIYSLLFDVNHF